MKKFLTIIALLTLFLLTFSSCSSPDEPKEYQIPSQEITYSHFEIGNVIDQGKQAIFLCFESEYPVSKIQATGSLLDKNGNTIYTFDSSLSFDTPSNTPDLFIRVEPNIVNNLRSISFTNITAYTKEKID